MKHLKEQNDKLRIENEKLKSIIQKKNIVKIQNRV
jgi:regulator of replication initiation timing